MKDSFKARTTLASGSNNFEIFSLAALKDRNVARLPYSLKILLENLLRFEDGVNVTRADIDALLNWDPKAAPSYEISFSPSRKYRLRAVSWDYKLPPGISIEPESVRLQDGIPTDKCDLSRMRSQNGSGSCTSLYSDNEVTIEWKWNAWERCKKPS